VEENPHVGGEGGEEEDDYSDADEQYEDDYEEFGE